MLMKQPRSSFLERKWAMVEQGKLLQTCSNWDLGRFDSVLLLLYLMYHQLIYVLVNTP